MWTQHISQSEHFRNASVSTFHLHTTLDKADGMCLYLICVFEVNLFKSFKNVPTVCSHIVRLAVKNDPVLLLYIC